MSRWLGGGGVIRRSLSPPPVILDPFWSQVVFLAPFDGVNGSTTMPDVSSAAHGNASIIGDSQLDTSQFKFGTASVLFDGTGDSIFWNDSNDWTLATSNSEAYTIEGWVRFTARSGNQALIQHSATIGNFGWRLYVPSGNLTNLIFETSADGTSFNTVTTSSAGLSDGAWIAVAVDHNTSGKVRVYVDGVMRGSATPADSSINNSTTTLSLGGGVGALNAALDEWRITKGIARYDSDSGYSVATSAFSVG